MAGKHNNSVPTDTVRGNTKTTREDWISAAKKLFVEEGMERVKIDRLAKKLKVTRGGFYWFFKNRKDLLDAILAEWLDPENDAITNAVIGKNNTPLDPLVRVFRTILDIQSYNPAIDSAMRDWARVSKEAHNAIGQVDGRRIGALAQAFENLNYETQEAIVRARILYFHQIGYYAMDINESYDKRLELIPQYFKQLTGYDMPGKGL